MRDRCEAELIHTPRAVVNAGWVWSRQNAPLRTDANRAGKWMLFPRCGLAVAAWRSVVQAGADGQIWLAKVAPSASRGSHLICVYTPDFTDGEAVETVIRRLDDLGLVERTVYYKPDIFTYAGIYNRGGSAGRSSVYEYRPVERRVQKTAALQQAFELLAEARRDR